MDKAELTEEVKKLLRQIEEFKSSDAGIVSTRFESIFNNLPQATYICKRHDRDFLLLDWNSVAEKLPSTSVSDLRGKKIGEVIPGRNDIIEAMNECLDNGKNIEREYKYVFRGEQSVKDISVVYIYVPPDMVMVQVEDITGQKKTEEALKNSEIMFKKVINNVEDVIVIVDQDINYKYVSPSIEHQRGYTVEEAMNLAIKDMLAEESYNRVLSFFKQDKKILQLGEKKTIREFLELEVIRKDGSTFWAEFNVSRLLDSKGQFAGYLSVCRDISDRKKTEKLLEYEKDRFRKITESAGAGIVFISKDYEILWSNKAIDNIFGNVRGSKCFSALFQRFEVCPECGVREVFENGKERATCSQIGKDVKGSVVYTYVITTPVRDDKGNVESALAIIFPSYSARLTREDDVSSGIEKTMEKKLQEFDSIKSEMYDFILKTVERQKSAEELSERWMSLDEIASYLGIKRDTVYKWIKRKYLPSHKIGGLWKFRLSEIKTWLESHPENKK